MVSSEATGTRGKLVGLLSREQPMIQKVFEL